MTTTAPHCGQDRTTADLTTRAYAVDAQLDERRIVPGSQGVKMKERPRRAGLTSGMGGVRHPVGLPEGYHTASRGQSFATSAGRLHRGLPPGPPRGRALQADGMTHVGRSFPEIGCSCAEGRPRDRRGGRGWFCRPSSR